MSQYHTFTAHDAVAYAQQFAGIDNPSELVSAQEVGDGNLNLVFKVFDRQGVSRAIVKQALPYVRCVGESWPLTLDRARLEAQTLVAHYQHSPQHTVKIHHFDPELAVMVMEDLSDHRIWRGELIANVYYPQAALQLGDYLAQVLFHTSDFYLHPHEKKAQVAQFINPAMCEITEDLFFNDPYQIHERNNYPAELEADVAALRDDAQLKLAVAALKHRFFAHAEALLHGDIHSGSIFVAEGSLKAIDAEFGYFGPIGFDIGTAIGNLLLNYCGLPGDKYHAVAEKYLPNGSCGVVSFGVKGGREAAAAFMGHLKIAAIETHVADARTCCLHPASSTHRQMNDEQLIAAGVQPDLVRMSCGLEDKNDLIHDIAQALDQI